MATRARSTSVLKLTKSGYPRCLRCGKTVEKLTISADPNDSARLVVDFQCHGESVSQEIPRAMVTGPHGLAAYSVFSDYTSGLLPAPPRVRELAKRAGKK